MGIQLLVRDLVVSLFRGLEESQCHDATIKVFNVLQHDEQHFFGGKEEWNDEEAEETQQLAAVAAFELRQRGQSSDADCLEFGSNALQLSRNKAFDDSLRVMLVLREKDFHNIATDCYAHPGLMSGVKRWQRKSMRYLQSPPMALSVSSLPPSFSRYCDYDAGMQQSEASRLWGCHDSPLPITCFSPETFTSMPPFGKKYFRANNGYGFTATNTTIAAGFHGLMPIFNLEQDKSQHCMSLQLSPSGAEYFLSTQPDLVSTALRLRYDGVSSLLPPPLPQLPVCLPMLGEQHTTSSSLVPLSTHEDGSTVNTSFPHKDNKDVINVQLEMRMVGWEAGRQGVEGLLPLMEASARQHLQLTREGWNSVAQLITHDKAEGMRLGRPGDDKWLSRRALEAMQGMPAPGFLYNPSDDCPTMLTDPTIAVGAAKGLLDAFSTAGQSLWWLRSLADYLRDPVNDECGKPTLPFGSVVQAFGCGLAEQVSIIQADILGFLEEIDQYSLLSLTHVTRPLHWLIKALTNLCCLFDDDGNEDSRVISVTEAADALPRGSQLLSMLFAKALETEALTGDEKVDNLGFSTSMRVRCSLLSLLRSASTPYLEFLSRWMWTGRLTRQDDPFGEFFIRCTAGDDVEELKNDQNDGRSMQYQPGSNFMLDAFEINEDSLFASQTLPFLQPQLLARVIASGKSLAMLRMCSWEHYDVTAITPAPPLIMGLGGSTELHVVQSAWKELRGGQVRRALALSRKGRAEAALVEMELLDRMSEREMKLKEEKNAVESIRKHRDALDKVERTKQRFWAQELLRIDAGRKEELKNLARIENNKHNTELRIAEENVREVEMKAAQWLYDTFKEMGDEQESMKCIKSWFRKRCNRTRDEGMKEELRNLLEEEKKAFEAEKLFIMSMIPDDAVAAQTLPGKDPVTTPPLRGLTGELKSDDAQAVQSAARQLQLYDDSLEADNGKEFGSPNKVHRQPLTPICQTTLSVGPAITKPPIAAAIDGSTVLTQTYSIDSSNKYHIDYEGVVHTSPSNHQLMSLSGKPFEGPMWDPPPQSKQGERRSTLPFRPPHLPPEGTAGQPLPLIESLNTANSVESSNLGAAVTFGPIESTDEKHSGGVEGTLIQPMEYNVSSSPSLTTELVKLPDLALPRLHPPINTPPPPPVPQSMEQKANSATSSLTPKLIKPELALSPHLSRLPSENVAIPLLKHLNPDSVIPLTPREETLPLGDVEVKFDSKGRFLSPCMRKEIEKNRSNDTAECLPAVAAAPKDGVGAASAAMGFVDVVEQDKLESEERKCKGGDTQNSEFWRSKSTKLEEYLKRAIAVARSGTQGLQYFSAFVTAEGPSAPQGYDSLCAPIASSTYSVISLYESIFHSLEVPITLQCNLIDSMSFSYVLQEGELGSHVLDLRCFFLGHSGGFLSEFVGCFYDSIVLLLDGGSCSDMVLNRVIIEAYAQAAATSRLEDQWEGWGGNGARFCYQLNGRNTKMEDMSVMQPLPGPTQMTPPPKANTPNRIAREEESNLYLDDDARAPPHRAVLGFIRPFYSLSWPSCVMIPPRVMSLYEEIHCNLLEQHLTLHRLRRYWVAMRECWKVARIRQIQEALEGFHLQCKLRELSIFHHSLHHVANSLLQYCSNQTYVGWPDLHEILFCKSTIREACDSGTDVSFDGNDLNPKLDLASLHDAHEAYVKSVHQRFFLEAGVSQYARVRRWIAEFQDIVGEADRLWSHLSLKLSLGHEITVQYFHEFRNLRDRFTTVKRELTDALLVSAERFSTDVSQIEGLLFFLEP